MNPLFTNLFIFEMANNHQGDIAHGIAIIREMGKLAKKHNINAAVKFQYRHLDSFIHLDFKNDKKAKHISRFLSTELKKEQFLEMVKEVKNEGMLAICTPFDEQSVDLVVEHEIDIIKIASCSVDDWPLINKIVETDKPIIASTGGLDLTTIDNLVSFLSNRNKSFAILHCVGIYPTPNELLNLRFIEKMKSRYPGVTIGYSGHEAPDNYDVIKIATVLGAEVFERHVGIATDKITLNNYSMNPSQVDEWISSFHLAKVLMGNKEKKITETEEDSLTSLKRGVFVNKKIKKGQAILPDDVFFAMPKVKNQLSAGEFGRLRARFAATKNYEPNEPVFESSEIDNYYKLRIIIHKAKGMLAEANIVLNSNAEVELSHHYGLENFYKFGCLIVNIINREYCKKIIIVFPGQHHPEHRHLKKEETFHILKGELNISLNGILRTLVSGDIVIIERGVSHSFYSENGAIFEEVSTTHFKNDSFYTDPLISEEDPMARKTVIKQL